ncbi:MAG: hypothetical protein IT582_06145, partial [Opitutaceae bacterium]|nr:hypothetical protein [Opitutaceae bacterium]
MSPTAQFAAAPKGDLTQGNWAIADESPGKDRRRIFHVRAKVPAIAHLRVQLEYALLLRYSMGMRIMQNSTHSLTGQPYAWIIKTVAIHELIFGVQVSPNMKHTRRLSVLLTFLLTFVPAVLSANDGPRLPEDVFPELAAVLDTALKQSPRMVMNQLNLEVAEGAEIEAKSGLYPSIGGYYNQQEARDKREDVPGRRI